MSDNTSIKDVHLEMSNNLVGAIRNAPCKYRLDKDGFAECILIDKAHGEEVEYEEWQESKSASGKVLNTYRFARSSHLGLYIEFRLGKDHIAKCDVEFLHLLTTYHWYYSERHQAVEARIPIGGGKRLMVKFHRYIMTDETKYHIYHINDDNLDQRKANLSYIKPRAPLTVSLDAAMPKVVVNVLKITKIGAWLGGKTMGGLGFRRNTYHVHFSTSPKVDKYFVVSRYESAEAALKAAQDYRYKTALERDEVRNQYRHVWDDKRNEYIEVKLQKGEERTFFCDVKDLELVKSRIWFVSDDYIRSAEPGGGHVKFHKLVLPEFEEVDHINGNTMDNRRVNLRDGTERVNMTNKGISKNNTSGATGVSYVASEETWIAIWYEKGIRKTRSFNERTYGAEEAKRLAFESRREVDKLLGFNVCQSVSKE